MAVRGRENEPPQSDPIAYFLTWPTYGTWLPGDERGWVEYRRGWQFPDPIKKLESEARMAEDACILNGKQRLLVEATVRKHCQIRGWTLHAVNCRTNHLHVVVSAAPLASLESHFSVDSSGFSGCRFDRWIDYKYGAPIKRVYRAWVKAHIVCGCRTNVVPAIRILEQDANDSPQLKPLLETTAKRFTIKEVSADLAYSSEANLFTIEGHGAAPLIPFKKNATAAKGGLWAKAFHYFNLHRDEFLARYHQRSNVEATFSAIKRRFGHAVRSKTELAMKNEVLAKFVCHNITCLVQAMYEMGVNPVFWVDQAQAE